MKKYIVGFLSLSMVALCSGQAWSWMHANRFGGGTAHSFGATTHVNAWGGSTSHAYGMGTAHYGGYHPPVPVYHPGYHPPTTVHYYGSGCYNCGGWSTGGAAVAGAAVGMVAGAAIASANTAAATNNAYNAGVAAGSAAALPVQPVYVMGAIYPVLPSGCVTPTVQGVTYYLCGNTWFQPSYGANGVYYRVVTTP